MSDDRYIVSAIRPDGTVEYLDIEKRRAIMRKLDQLGPLTRAVIMEAPKDIDLDAMLAAYRERPRALVDPDDPRTTFPIGTDDERMASWIAEQIRCRMPHDYRPIEPRKRRHG